MAGAAPLGIIGGSGLYRMAGLASGVWREVTTPWGEPSDALLFGSLCGRDIVFLPRHGRGHRIPPGDLPGRANIAALKAAGCDEILAISAVGSFDETMPPGSFVLVDQYVDRTVRGERSFFEAGIVGHVGFARPTCPRLGARVAAALVETGTRHRIGGTMLVMEGSQFSTVAESRLHKAWGMDVVGMTALPEAKLAREAELCYANVAMVTDFDAWSDVHVSVEEVVRVLADNAAAAQALIAAVAAQPAHDGPCSDGCGAALEGAVITAREGWPEEQRARLATLAPRIFA